MFDIWWIYAVAAGLVACVILQAWDRRHCAKRGARQEKGRVEKQAALRAQTIELAKPAPASLKA